MSKRSAFRDTWKDYLSFSRREKRGIFALILIIIIQISVLFYMRIFPSKETPIDFSKIEKELDEFYAVVDRANDSLNQLPEVAMNNQNNKSEKKKPEIKDELFVFNPNNLPEEDWRKLGFTDKQITVIKNYEAKGGKFYSKEDVKKMYCISDEHYKQVEKFIDIPEAKTNNDVKPERKYTKENMIIDIGIADSSELVLLRGIGPAFARRISIYRNKLGGFVRMEQLKEVWGFTDSLYGCIKPSICLKDSLNIRQINLNAADFNEMRNHPYIGYQLANMISNYRKQHNGIKDLNEIKKLPLVNDQLYSKLAPYLKIE